jgi:sterol 22-desaturase
MNHACCVQVLEDIREAEEKGVPPPVYSSNHRMAEVIMDFLFASQDASTSSLTWTLALLDEHPEVLEKVQTCQLLLPADIA